MAKTAFWDIIESTIEKVATPLSAKGIWDKANEIGTIGLCYTPPMAILAISQLAVIQSKDFYPPLKM